MIDDIINKNFPKAKDCIDGHIGDPVVSYQMEYDDDRGYLMKVTRCGHCNIPLRDEYATKEEEEAYYASKKS